MPDQGTMSSFVPEPVARTRVAYRTWRVQNESLLPESGLLLVLWAREIVGQEAADWRRHRAAEAENTWAGRDGQATADEHPKICSAHGIHAWLELDYARMAPWREDRVKGAIAAWGRVIIHEHGLRAEHAKVLAFLDEGQPCLPGLADRYGVPVLDEAGLVFAYAGWWGE